jgi:hypothetical protein
MQCVPISELQGKQWFAPSSSPMLLPKISIYKSQRKTSEINKAPEQHNKMCIYNYYQYDVCGHRIIELTEYCPKTLWIAGIKGELQPCGEEIYAAQILNLKLPLVKQEGYYWKGMSGFCKNCEAEFAVRFLSMATDLARRASQLYVLGVPSSLEL